MSIYNQCVSDRTIKNDHYHNYWNDAVIYNDDAAKCLKRFLADLSPELVTCSQHVGQVIRSY
jgi:hypothetical protein